MERLTCAAVLRLLASKARDRSGGQAGLARELRISPQYLSDVMNGRRGLTPTVLRRLGLRAVTLYEAIRK